MPSPSDILSSFLSCIDIRTPSLVGRTSSSISSAPRAIAAPNAGREFSGADTWSPRWAQILGYGRLASGKIIKSFVTVLHLLFLYYITFRHICQHKSEDQVYKSSNYFPLNSFCDQIKFNRVLYNIYARQGKANGLREPFTDIHCTSLAGKLTGSSFRIR